MIWIATAICVLAAATGDDDASRKLTAEAFPHSIHRTALPNEPGSGFQNHFQYWIHIDETDQDVALGRFYEDEYDGLGYNGKQLDIEWLDPGRALWLHWETVNQGTGHYIAQGNVVLVKDGSRWSEIIRDCRPSYTRGYGGDPPAALMPFYDGVRMQFRWNGARQALQLTESVYRSEWSNAPGPLGRPHDAGDSGVAYGGEFTITRAWEGVLKDGALVFGAGKEYLATDGDDDSFLVKDFAAYLSERHGRPDALAELLRLHPGRTADSVAEEPFLVSDSIPAFVPQPDDIYHTGL